MMNRHSLPESMFPRGLQPLSVVLRLREEPLPREPDITLPGSSWGQSWVFSFPIF